MEERKTLDKEEKKYKVVTKLAIGARENVDFCVVMLDFSRPAV